MLEAKGLRITLGGRLLLVDVDLSLERGERVAILGRSGSGKTTLLRVLAGLLNPDGGKIHCDDFAYPNGPSGLAESNGAALWPTLSMVFQDYRLLPHLTARKNCLLGLNQQSGAARELTALAGEFALGDCLDRTPSMLSHGERQRFAILRALLRQPRYLFLDEPTSALDLGSQDTLIRLLNRAPPWNGMAILTVTHDVHFAARIANRYIEIRDQRLVDHDDLVKLFSTG